MPSFANEIQRPNREESQQKDDTEDQEKKIIVPSNQRHSIIFITSRLFLSLFPQNPGTYEDRNENAYNAYAFFFKLYEVKVHFNTLRTWLQRLFLKKQQAEFTSAVNASAVFSKH